MTSSATSPICVIGNAQRRGNRAISHVYPVISTPMMKPAASSTYGRLSAPSDVMNFERVMGFRM